MFTFSKDPNEVRAFTWYWTADLNGSTIASATFVVPPGITKDSQSNTTTTATAVFSGGTAGEVYPVTCRVVTAAGETLDYTALVEVAER